MFLPPDPCACHTWPTLAPPGRHGSRACPGSPIKDLHLQISNIVYTCSSHQTRMLVTHGLHWLPRVDMVVIFILGYLSDIFAYEYLILYIHVPTTRPVCLSHMAYTGSRELTWWLCWFLVTCLRSAPMSSYWSKTGPSLSS